MSAPDCSFDYIITLSELRKHLTDGRNLDWVVNTMPDLQCCAKIVDRTPELMPGSLFRYFIIQLDAKGLAHSITR